MHLRSGGRSCPAIASIFTSRSISPSPRPSAISTTRPDSSGRWGSGDTDPADDFDLATATIPAAHCPPPAVGKTNLEISKHPLGRVCTDKVGFFECRYYVVVRNTGSGVYNGLIKVDETIPAGATATFSPASWSCTGSAPTFSCERWPVALLPNEAVNLNVIMKLPKNLARGL